MRRLRRAHADLLASLDLAIAQASDPAVYGAAAPAVSAWSVKDHLEHLSVANAGIVRWLERVCEGDADLDSGGRPTLVGRVVLLVGAFPRGRGRAPEPTLPQGTSADEIVERARRTKERAEALGDRLAALRSSKATRHHFVFGTLDASQWLRFAVIHNRHHQKIIRDVLKAARVGPAPG